jgi:hypothetical protein
VINAIIITVQLTLLGLYFWGMIRAARRTTGPAPWPLRLIVDAKGSPRMSFIYVMLVVSAILFVVSLATWPSEARQRSQQLDRIEQLLREIRDELGR